MKKVNKKLSLNKNVVASLNDVKGGNPPESNGQGCVSGGVGLPTGSCGGSCYNSCDCSGWYCTFLIC